MYFQCFSNLLVLSLLWSEQALKRLHFDIVAQIATTVFVAYTTFIFAEGTPIHVSGVLAVVLLGLTLASSFRTYCCS